MTRKLEVTLNLDERSGFMSVIFHDRESGDASVIRTTVDNCEEEECRIGSELMAWFTYMVEEAAEVNDEH